MRERLGCGIQAEIGVTDHSWKVGVGAEGRGSMIKGNAHLYDARRPPSDVC